MRHPRNKHKPSAVLHPPRAAKQSPPSCAGDLICSGLWTQDSYRQGQILVTCCSMGKFPLTSKVVALCKVRSAQSRMEESGDASAEQGVLSPPHGSDQT